VPVELTGESMYKMKSKPEEENGPMTVGLSLLDLVVLG
jgi:hypothetical protein